MTNTGKTKTGDLAMTLKDLETALDTFGADRTRWPAPLRHALANLIAADPQAARLVRDAEAFDQLLDSAPALGSDALQALSARIAASAERQPRVAAGNADVSASRPSNAAPPRFGRAVPRRDQGIAAVALAASLVLGILAGQTSVIDPAAQLLIGATNSNADTAYQELANVDEDGGLLNEDLL